MRRLFIVIIIILYGAISCYAQTSIVKDVRGEIYDDTAQIIIEANCDIEYIDYVLEDPPRLIIDPIGKIYSDLKEVIEFDSGPIKKVIIVKGRPEEGLTGSFYPLDFISMELTSLPEYKVRKDIKEEVIVEISKRQDTVLTQKISLPVEQVTQKKPQPLFQEEPEAIALPEIRIQKAPAPKVEKPIIAEPKPVQQPVVNLVQRQEESPGQTSYDDIPFAGPKGQGPASADTGQLISEIIPLEMDKQVPAESSFVGEPEKVIYKIGKGDSLDISVWQHPELDKRVMVRPDGFVSFPLVGDISAEGMTPPRLSLNIKERLSRLIKDPQVTVIVSGFGSKNVLVLGEVLKPGAYSFRGGTNVLDAISDAGGWKNSAVLNSVILVRKVFTYAPEAYRLNVYDIIKHSDFTQNMPLQPGDVIYVPKSFIANIGGFIENLRVNVGAYVTESTRVFD